MRIVYVITRADAVGGASIHVRDLAREMLRRGHEATVLVGGKGPVTEQLEAAGVPFRSLRYLQRAIHPLQDFRALDELMAILRNLQPDIVSAHTAKAGLLGRAACKRLGLPAIYTPHGWSIGSRISRITGPLFGVAERMAAPWSRAIISVCEAEKQMALEHRIAPPEKLHVIYNGIQDIPPQQMASPGREPVRICCVARFEAPKDHATLLRALGTLRDLDWQLDLVGEGPLLYASQKLAIAEGIGERVQFCGYQRDAAPVLARAQLFTLASRSEAFPRSILEAMRAGLPAVASAVGGVPEAVRNNESGLLVSPESVEALAAALRRLIENKVERERLGKGARHLFSRHFRLDRMAEETLALYVRETGRV